MAPQGPVEDAGQRGTIKVKDTAVIRTHNVLTSHRRTKLRPFQIELERDLMNQIDMDCVLSCGNRISGQNGVLANC